VAVEDNMPPVFEALRAVDSAFREIPHQADGRFTTLFTSRSGGACKCTRSREVCGSQTNSR
jgi:hypothetical protein